MTLEIWNTTTKSHSNLDDVLLFNNSASDYILSHTDKTYFSEEMDNYVSRARGYFIPPFSGNYSFMVKADDGASLYLSNSENPNDKVKHSCIFFSLTFEKMKEHITNLLSESSSTYCNMYVVCFFKNCLIS